MKQPIKFQNTWDKSQPKILKYNYSAQRTVYNVHVCVVHVVYSTLHSIIKSNGTLYTLYSNVHAHPISIIVMCANIGQIVSVI